MPRRPLILILPSTEKKGVEFADSSLSLSNRYTEAVIAAGGLPLVFPATTHAAVAAESVDRADGVIISGGDDIDPKLDAPKMPAKLRQLVGPIEADRDVWEATVIKQILARRKPLLGICRGHQMVNVALGGTLIVDIATQVKGPVDHRQMAKKSEPVHDVDIEPDSLLARLTGKRKLAVNSTHHQAPDKMAPQLKAVAKAADGVIEAAELKDPAPGQFLLTVQFHPERLVDKIPVFRRLFKGFVDACARGQKD